VDSEGQEIEAAIAELTHAMAGLVRVIDAKGADAVASHISDSLTSALEELSARLNAIRGFAAN
jgi:hypothetical protein